MQGRAVLIASLCLWVLSPAAYARDGWTFEALFGDAYNFDSRLKIDQGEYTRSLSANYATRGFDTPLYYSARLSNWQGKEAWEFQLIHHKLYLNNPPPGVTSLSISHGFNIVTLNRAIDRNGWILRLGAGPVITHAEAVINGASYDGPYEISGAALLAGTGRRFYISRSMFIQIDAAATAAYAEPRTNGTPALKLSVSNIGVHGMFGLGINF